ncbi:uncharacterized protein DUF2470 [Stackebrandtia albiflava]|uniref:Uncharacterized protein DUF2470 n=1 Tax=Stackebrandtia albiflava TaxID=406432 RepID=A0A562V3X2_9ACTN|nr:DUF2470 domain-containing protein [Stackebrandtia albiflava]TWJ12563.1 uncharacterized protein DUF2470 [Stackebrandtia albiflava]
MNPFEDSVIEAITRHMNRDHTADTLVICRGVGGHDRATAARMDTFDATGAEFTTTVDGVATPLRIAWSKPLSTRAEVRPEIVRMYHESRARLGLAEA